MNEYWRGININDIEDISGIGGSFSSREGESSFSYFTIKMKDGRTNRMIFEDRNAYKYRPELMKIYNEVNGITEYYQLRNEAYAVINGEAIEFGCRCDTWLGESVYLTLLEIDELRKEFKIKDDGRRQLAFITMIEIEGAKVVRGEINDKNIKQLKALGYNVDALTH